jgi:membrane protein EpsK
MNRKMGDKGMQPPLTTVPLDKENALGGTNRRERTTLLFPDAASRRFTINVGSNLGYVVLNTALMLWYIPFLIRHLGVADYGMIPLANSLVMYAVIISGSLETSINRFLAIDLNQANTASANRTFNTALALSLAACGVMLGPMAAVAYVFPVLFNVPPGSEIATRFLFACVGSTMLVAIISGNFGVASVITHRFDLRNIVRALMSLSRIGIVALCFLIWPASLWYVGTAFILSSCIGFIGDVLIWSRLTPDLHIDFRNIDSHRLRALLGLSGWSALNLIGYLLLLQTDLLIVNALFGAEWTGRYGSVQLLPQLVNMIVETIIAVLSPAIMAQYALGNIAGMQQLARRSTKLVGLALALPIGLLCGLGGPLLSLWLGPDFAQLEIVLILLVGHLAMNSAARPLAYVLTAFNRVRLQGLLTLGLGFGNVALAIALALWSGWGVAGVAAAAAIAWTLRNAVFLSAYSAAVMRLRLWTFYPLLMVGVLGTVGVGLAARLSLLLWTEINWLTLFATAAAVSAAYVSAAYLVGLSRSDRDILRQVLRRGLPG